MSASLGRKAGLPLHLRVLEAEAIHILREVVGQARAPVLMYSIGKDSSVLLHLCRKAFYPGVPPFPLLHIDTRWKFRDMIAFRDRTVRAFIPIPTAFATTSIRSTMTACSITR